MTVQEGGPEPIIQARALSKWYGQVIGLNNFAVRVMPGITGIVGPNGSGKSTFFKLVLGLIKPNAGSITVLGKGPWKNPELHSSIGFCPDYESLPTDSTGREYLTLIGKLHMMHGTALADRINEVVRLVEMGKAVDRRTGGYSKGMKQRMKIAGAMLHDPKLLILDEPLSGTDPLVRKDIIDLIKRLNKEHEHDIIVSSHVLFEIERMTHDVALVYRGRTIASGDISEIRNLIDRHPHNIIIEGQGTTALAKMLLDQDYVVSVRFNESKDSVTVQVSEPNRFFDGLPALIENAQCSVTKMYSLDDNLEAVFRYLVGG
ncbi:MAG: ABC transporter ATP-binding protein [Candidatus Thermoplasmatota archaeon]|nr:ABC transporter ATP-binding protein [Candidatus Thermoplasmatota archaeon]